MKQVFLATALSLLAPVAACADLVTITGATVFSRANDRGSGEGFVAFYNTAIPSFSPIIATSGSNRSATTINWREVQGQTRLEFGFDHRRDGTFESYAQSAAASLFFTVASETPYDLSGHYFAMDIAPNQSGRVVQEVMLRDQTTDSIIFRNVQDSRSTRNERFTLGFAGGDTSNILTGSLSGQLLAERQYELYFNVHIIAAPDADLGAAAEGTITLVVGQASTVPEPSSCLIVFVMASAALVAWNRRRRRAKAAICLEGLFLSRFVGN